MIKLFASIGKSIALSSLQIREFYVNLFTNRNLSNRQYFEIIFGLNPEVVLLDRVFRRLEKKTPHLNDLLLRVGNRIFPLSLHTQLHYASYLYRMGSFEKSLNKYQFVFGNIDRLKGPVLDIWYDHYFELLFRFYPESTVEAHLRGVLTRLKTIGQYQPFFFFLAKYGSKDLLARLIVLVESAPLSLSKESWIFGIFEIIDLNHTACRATLDVLAPESKMTFVEPPVFEDNGPKPIHEIAAPSLWIASIDDVQVIGSYGVLKNGKMICYEPAAHPRNGLVAGCHKYLTGIHHSENNALIAYQFNNVQHIPEVILIGGRCSSNYFHWLIEYMPRFWSIDQRPSLRNIPVLVDKGLYPQQIEVLKILLGDRPVIEFDHNRLLSIDRVHIPSVPTYLPDRFDIPYWQTSALVKAPLEYVRTRVLSGIEKLNWSDSPRRIFLSRRGALGRKMENEKSIEAIFQGFDFKIVCPEDLSFVEQVRLFHGADIIGAAAGASLSNTLFCHKGTQVLALTSERNRGFGMHAGVAEIGGARFLFVSGNNLKSREHFNSDSEFAHSGFSIDENKLVRAIQAVLAPEGRISKARQAPCHGLS